ncbi:GDP-L-fucose synthase [Polystyrenella longa]|uniref:GDP-L-fucose synthase n=1 Tax=Polystyrenella longa TaxID=2528007 RepID=A0A518CLR0_9PLAN|nr:NAD(P)-dependent oxidoreductase [Polystyrenella longa]QDU80165.1 GDP-L-fucose synthase [Polystyrenella longa]
MAAERSVEKKLKVGLTGANGNIGTTLREGLRDEVEFHYFTHKAEDLEGTVADLSDSSQVEGIFEGLDAVIHLAGYIMPSTPWDEVLKNNIDATYNVFEECRRAGVKKIIFASTNHTQHGDFMDDSPMKTDPDKCRHHARLFDPPAPDSLYGVSKLFGENLGKYFSLTHRIQFVGLRIGWTEQADDPHTADGTEQEYHMSALFLSKRDCVEAFRKALETNRDYVLGYALSNNKNGIFDMRETAEKLGFVPRDSANYWPECQNQ